jgi:hypothetical protein
MSAILIEIEYPWEAHTLLSNDFIDQSHSAQAFRLDLIKKIRRGILEKEYGNVWRQIEAFPGYEMTGSGWIRHLGSHEGVVITVVAEEPVVVHLDDIHGMVHEVLLETLINDNFPELTE